MSNEALESTLAAVGSKATYAGSGTVGVGWLLSNEFAILIGLIVGVAGFIVNWHYKAKQDRRAEREHIAHMKRLASKPDDLP